MNVSAIGVPLVALSVWVLTAISGIEVIKGPPPALDPIVVNSISWAGDGTVLQDRTVTTSGSFLAVWQAEVLNARTGLAVDGCQGSGWWNYAPGNRAVPMPLSEWVGGPCDLAPGSYFLRATYSAGEWSITQRSLVFTVGVE